MSQHERTGWRCQWISARHRQWPRNCPATDIDAIVTANGISCDDDTFRVVESNWGKIYAVIEYKARGAKIDTNGYNCNVLRTLANQAGIAFFIVLYDAEKVLFGVSPQNDEAKKILMQTKVYDENGYIRLLQTMRGLP